ncbi:MAG: zinc-ribbon domain-containing protein [Alphaproteobacteria bacterium]|nr:zinc-ribbon domain-containing protein [Alphaproteobacteria bacterium]MBU1515618.1 zinc-ribbon domain-containing protein [Alphaproteobacteria bacterium]MBU2096953.1 zinc-ribbon domain-containing protein [Alphaproteobacteria bacterium]MBU2149608.1 zinc-ribbon domain-containing protein [Alphaproteobacteria bacterium]MBU2305656.1 zinc-ribbon domain-containing protein [Alphaproteobacteria bacterium]
MALIACPECGKQVSSAAPACPSCGHPIAGGEISKTDVAGRAVSVLGAWLVSGWVARAIFVIVIGIVAIFLFSR